MFCADLFKTCIEIAMLVHVLGSVLLIVLSKKFLITAVYGEEAFVSPGFSEKVVMLVPVGNVGPTVEESLRSLLEQEYTDYSIIFITATHAEPASRLIERLCSEYVHANHVVAGKAERCCQKNHNLLAGIERTSPEDSILVFCDSSHFAKPDFLARLISPIVHREALMTSGYRYIVPGDDGYGTFCQLLTVQYIHMLFQAIASLAQPWGGATAIRRTTFIENNIPKLWANTIVDDFTMGPFLQKKGIRVTPVAEACLLSHLSGQTLQGWEKWLFRQLQYLKFGMPVVWVVATILPLLFVGIVGYILGTIVDPTSRTVTVALCYIFLLGAIGVTYSKIIPNTMPVFRRVVAYFLLHFVFVFSFFRTWSTNIVSWQNICYRTRLGGEVVEIIRPQKQKGC